MRQIIDNKLRDSLELLAQSNKTVSEIAYAIGFNDSGYFSKCFKLKFGCSPSDYRKRAFSRMGEEEQEKMTAGFVDDVKSKIINHMSSSDFGTIRLADLMNMSTSTLYRRIKSITRKSPGIYLRSIKLDFARDLILQGRNNIGDIAIEAGFEDIRYFNRCFKSEFGLTPSKFLQQSSN
ncbi:MAG: helix-turn-helix transcriptional regulator [Paludibacter sp.]|nr:helix-turn-helix transcriptional regulator [Paludibacter sp.]